MALDEKSKPIYHPWAEEEFTANHRVRRMTDVQRWMYRTLCHAAFFCSTRPYLPDDDSELWMLADCDSPEIWENNKQTVRAMFFRVEQDGVGLLGHKRILLDWDRVQERREALAKRGREGAMKRWMAVAKPELSENIAVATEEMATAKENIAAVCKGSEVKGREEKEEEMSLEKKKNADAALRDISFDVLGQAEEAATFRKQLKDVVAAHGRDAVVDTFKAWALVQVSPYPGGRPISAFLRVAKKLISEGAPTESEHPVIDKEELVQLMDDIAVHSNNDVVFNPNQRLVILRLLGQYGRADVLAGFRDFYARVDDNSKPYAAKDFAEKGEQFVRTKRALRVKAQQQEQFMTEQAEIQTQEAQAEIDQILEAENEEAAKTEIL